MDEPNDVGLTLAQVLEAIEHIVGDDQCEDWEMENAHRRFRGRARDMQEKLSQIYRMAHSAVPTHSCHHVHKRWREETLVFAHSEELA